MIYKQYMLLNRHEYCHIDIMHNVTLKKRLCVHLSDSI
jgi:hypothetical protein